MQSIFVTGTDTGIGKTLVSCALMRQLIADGHRVVGMKPVASGADLHAGELRNDDALRLMAAANVDVPYAWVNPYCFEPAIAPHIAAQQAGQHISPATIRLAYDQLAQHSDAVIVEGIGGWAVPINARQTMIDVAVVLNLPVVLVVGMRLGCLNHALITAQSIAASNLRFAGWIANTLDTNMPALIENIEILSQKLAAPLLGVIPHFSHAIETHDVKFELLFI